MSSLASMKRGLSNASLSGVLGILLAGCAANPYVKVNSPVPVSTIEDKGPISMAEAIKYANATMDEYRAARSAEFDRQQNVSGTLFGLGAVALGLAAYKAHSDAILGVGLIGATTYQASMWNTSAGRNQLYSEGINALACAQSVMAPVLVGPDQYKEVGAAIGDVVNKADAAAAADGLVYAAMLSADFPDSLRKALQDERASARKQLDRADKALAKASRYRVLVAQAGSTLKTHVDFIREGVDKGMLGTLADPRHLPDAVKRLADYATFFGTPAPASGSDVSSAPPGGLKAKDGVTTESNPLENGGRSTTGNQVVALIRATAALRASVSRLDNAYGKITGKSMKTALEGCNVDPASVATALQVEPSAIELTEGEARESDVSVSDGTGFYRVRLLDRSDTGITVTQPDGNSFRVQTTAKSSPGTYRVRVEDNTNAYAIVSVRVVAKTDGGNQGQKKSLTDGVASTCSAAGRSPTEICLAQQVLKVTTTGNFLTQSCKAYLATTLGAGRGGMLDGFAMADIKKQVDLPADADEAAMKAKLKKTCGGDGGQAAASSTQPPLPLAPVGAVVGCAPVAEPGKCSIGGARCQLECAMDTKVLAKLSKQLKLEPAPQSFDSILRSAIEAKKKDMKYVPVNGEYTPEFAVALDKLK